MLENKSGVGKKEQCIGVWNLTKFVFGMTSLKNNKKVKWETNFRTVGSHDVICH